MGNFQFFTTPLQDLYIVEQRIFADERGFFLESYNQKVFHEAGLTLNFVQDNHSKSQRGVLRGLHFQKKYPQGKLVRVLRGAVFDVAVDLRKDSPSFLKWFGCHLTEENRRQLYIPPGFAHGFLVLSQEAEFAYKCSDFYHPEDEGGYPWNDPAFGIEWPLEGIKQLILSEKDRGYRPYGEVGFSY